MRRCIRRITMKRIKSSLNEAIYEMINLPDSAAVIDLGCKNAAWLNGIIEEFPGKIAKAVGVDITDRHFSTVPYAGPVELRVMNCAGELDFSDGEFDLVLAKDMLECIPDKADFVTEINRILKPGGMVICVNADWDSAVFNGENKELISKAVHAYAVTQQGWMDDLDSWMGRRTYSVFHGSGYFESSVAMYSVVETEYKEGSMGYGFSRDIGWLAEENTGALTAEEYEAFLADLEAADKRGQYIFSKPYYIYRGIKTG